MKTRTLLLTVLLLPAVAATALAKDGNDGGGKRHGHHGAGIERMDTDQDGRISRAEFDAGRAAREARMAEKSEKAERKHDDAKRQPPDFAALDANRDGYIVRSELHAYHERLRPQREAERKARFEERFTEADLNRDGKLGRAEVSEKMPRMADRFAWMDENRDGFLTRAELQAGRTR